MSELNITENAVLEDKTVEASPVIETVENVPTTEAVETVEEAATEEIDDKKKKTKSFFSIFKKDEPAEVEAVDDVSPTEAVETEEVAEVTPGEEAVPVESTPVKKGLLCGLCVCNKKKKEAAEEVPAAESEAVEEAPAGEEVPVVEEAAVAEEVPTVDEAVAVAAAEEPESTEGEALVVEADIVRSGMLLKNGKFFKSKFNERNCRLLASGVFQWSKTEEFTKANECMIDAETTTVAFVAEGEDAVHKYRFELHCCNKVCIYASDSEEERDEWIRAFETIKESIVMPEAASEEVVAEESEEAAVAE